MKDHNIEDVDIMTYKEIKDNKPWDIKVISDLFFPTALFWSTVSVKGLVSISNIKPLQVDPFSDDSANNSFSYILLIESEIGVKGASGS